MVPISNYERESRAEAKLLRRNYCTLRGLEKRGFSINQPGKTDERSLSQINKAWLENKLHDDVPFGYFGRDNLKSITNYREFPSKSHTIPLIRDHYTKNYTTDRR